MAAEGVKKDKASAGRLLQDAGYLFANKILAPVTAFLLLILIAWRSDLLLGQYTLVSTVFIIVQTLPLLGLAPFVMREVARKPEDAGAYLTTVGAIALCACAVVIVAGQCMLGLEEEPVVRAALQVAILAIIPGILAFLGEVVLVALHRTRTVALVGGTECMLRLVASTVALYSGGGLVALVWVYGASRALTMVIYLMILTADGRSRPRPLPSMAVFRSALKVIPTFFVYTVLFVVAARLDYVVMRVVGDYEQLGHYGIAYRAYEIAMLAVAAFMTAVFTRLSRRFVAAPGRCAKDVQTLFVAVVLVFVPVALVGFGFAGFYVGLLFPKQYPEPVPLTEGFLVLLVLGAVDSLMSSVLLATDRQKSDLRALGWGSLVYAVSLAILTPWLLGVGAVMSLALALLTQATLRIRYVTKTIGNPAPVGFEVRMIAISAISFVGVLGLTRAVPGFWGGVLVATGAVTAYPVLVVAFGLVRPVQYLRVAWSRRQRRDPGTVAGFIDWYMCDVRRHVVYTRHARRGGAYYGNWSLLAIFLYRLSRLARLRGHSLAARLLWQLNHALTKMDISPEIVIGPGMVVPYPVGIMLAGEYGENCTFEALAASGRSGFRDIGAGAGLPVFKDEVHMGVQSVLLGPRLVEAGTKIAPLTLPGLKKERESSRTGEVQA